MAISAGDAVFNFVADTQNLDAAFDNLGPKAQKAVQPATDALDDVKSGFDDAGDAAEKAADSVEDAGKRTRTSLYEAKGEAALLGEEIGVRLPRHVRTFVAELPGVSTALSAAFGITAILFVANAVDEATKKLADFLFKTNDLSTKTNEQVKAEADALKAAQKGLDDFGKSADQLAREKIDALRDSINFQEKAAADAAQTMYGYEKTLGEAAVKEAAYRDAKEKYTAATEAAGIATREHDLAVKELLKSEAEEARNKNLSNLKTEIELRKQLAMTQVMYAEVVHGMTAENADEVRYQISINALKKLAAAEKEYGKDNEDTIRKINADIEQATVEHTLHLQEELNKQKDNLEKTLTDMQKSVQASNGIEIITPANVQHIIAGVEAVKALGVTLRSELVQKLNEAKLAEEAFAESGIKDAVALKALQGEVKKAQQALDDYGKSMDHTKAKSELTWKSITQDWKNGANAEHAAGELAQQTFNQVSQAMSSAFASAILGQEGWGKALERATAQALASMAAQALVKSLFYTAEGFAALAGFNAGSAAQFFEAAGIMAAVGGAAGGAARGLNGGSGSSGNNTYQYNNGQSNTGSQAGSGRVNVGVQHFADGGLILGPTKALVGEAGREAVLPLDNPDAMDTIGKALAGAGGVTHNHHYHINGMISADHLAKFAKRMNKAVSRGQATLNASSTFKVTRRGA